MVREEEVPVDRKEVEKLSFNANANYLNKYSRSTYACPADYLTPHILLAPFTAEETL